MMMPSQIEGHSWLDSRNAHNSWVADDCAGVIVRQAEANLSVTLSWVQTGAAKSTLIKAIMRGCYPLARSGPRMAIFGAELERF